MKPLLIASGWLKHETSGVNYAYITSIHDTCEGQVELFIGPDLQYAFIRTSYDTWYPLQNKPKMAYSHHLPRMAVMDNHGL